MLNLNINQVHGRFNVFYIGQYNPNIKRGMWWVSVYYTTVYNIRNTTFFVCTAFTLHEISWISILTQYNFSCLLLFDVKRILMIHYAVLLTAASECVFHLMYTHDTRILNVCHRWTDTKCSLLAQRIYLYFETIIWTKLIVLFVGDMQ